MTTPHPSRFFASGLHPTATLADLRAWVDAQSGLSADQRRDRLSAIHTVARWLRRDAGEIMASPAHVRERLKGLNHAAVGTSQRNWENVLSRLRRAQMDAGLSAMPGRSEIPLTPDWAALTILLKEKVSRLPLCRFARWCGARGMGPDQVTLETFDAYLADLRTSELKKDPRRVHKLLCQSWNKASRGLASWPGLIVEVPDYRNTYLVDWARFPPSLKAEIDAYLASRAAPDPFGEGARPIKPSTVALRSSQLHEYVSARCCQTNGDLSPARGLHPIPAEP